MTITEDEYRVYMMPFPGDIKSAVRLDAEGFPSIYINDQLAPEARKKAFLHEIRHIKRDDFYNSMTIQEVESDAPPKEAETKKAPGRAV